MDYNNPLAPAMAAVPLPANALPAAGTDGEMTVYQPSRTHCGKCGRCARGWTPAAVPQRNVGHGRVLARGDLLLRCDGADVDRRNQRQLDQVHHRRHRSNGRTQLGRPGGRHRPYRIYRGTSPTNLQLVGSLAHVTTRQGDPGCFWTDTGSETPSAVSPPTSNTATTPGQWHAAWGGRMSTSRRIPATTATSPIRSAGGRSSRTGA